MQKLYTKMDTNHNDEISIFADIKAENHLNSNNNNNNNLSNNHHHQQHPHHPIQPSLSLSSNNSRLPSRNSSGRLSQNYSVNPSRNPSYEITNSETSLVGSVNGPAGPGGVSTMNPHHGPGSGMSPNNSTKPLTIVPPVSKSNQLSTNWQELSNLDSDENNSHETSNGVNHHDQNNLSLFELDNEIQNQNNSNKIIKPTTGSNPAPSSQILNNPRSTTMNSATTTTINSSNSEQVQNLVNHTPSNNNAKNNFRPGFLPAKSSTASANVPNKPPVIPNTSPINVKTHDNTEWGVGNSDNFRTSGVEWGAPAPALASSNTSSQPSNQPAPVVFRSTSEPQYKKQISKEKPATEWGKMKNSDMGLNSDWGALSATSNNNWLDNRRNSEEVNSLFQTASAAINPTNAGSGWGGSANTSIKKLNESNPDKIKSIFEENSSENATASSHHTSSLPKTRSESPVKSFTTSTNSRSESIQSDRNEKNDSEKDMNWRASKEKSLSRDINNNPNPLYYHRPKLDPDNPIAQAGKAARTATIEKLRKEGKLSKPGLRPPSPIEVSNKKKGKLGSLDKRKHLEREDRNSPQNFPTVGTFPKVVKNPKSDKDQDPADLNDFSETSTITIKRKTNNSFSDSKERNGSFSGSNPSSYKDGKRDRKNSESKERNSNTNETLTNSPIKKSNKAALEDYIPKLAENLDEVYSFEIPEKFKQNLTLKYYSLPELTEISKSPICRSVPVSDTIDFTGKRYFCPRSDRWDPRLWLHAERQRKYPDLIQQEQIRLEMKKKMENVLRESAKDDKSRENSGENQDPTSVEPTTTSSTNQLSSSSPENIPKDSTTSSPSVETEKIEPQVMPKGPVEGSIGFTATRTVSEPKPEPNENSGKTALQRLIESRKAKAKLKEAKNSKKEQENQAQSTSTYHAAVTMVEKSAEDVHPRDANFPAGDIRDETQNDSFTSPRSDVSKEGRNMFHSGPVNTRHGERRHFDIFKQSRDKGLEKDWKAARESTWKQNLDEEANEQQQSNSQGSIQPASQLSTQNSWQSEQRTNESWENADSAGMKTEPEYAGEVETNNWMHAQEISRPSQEPPQKPKSQKLTIDELRMQLSNRKNKANEKEKIKKEEKERSRKPISNKYGGQEYLAPHLRRQKEQQQQAAITDNSNPGLAEKELNGHIKSQNSIKKERGKEPLTKSEIDRHERLFSEAFGKAFTREKAQRLKELEEQERMIRQQKEMLMKETETDLEVNALRLEV